MNYILTLTVLLTENGELIIVLPGLYAFTYILRKKLFVVFLFVSQYYSKPRPCPLYTGALK